MVLRLLVIHKGNNNVNWEILVVGEVVVLDELGMSLLEPGHEHAPPRRVRALSGGAMTRIQEI